MELKYTVHLDDYHSNITAFGVRSVQFAIDQVRGEIENGYEVTRVTLDGEPLDIDQPPAEPKGITTREATVLLNPAYAKRLGWS